MFFHPPGFRSIGHRAAFPHGAPASVKKRRKVYGGSPGRSFGARAYTPLFVEPPAAIEVEATEPKFDVSDVLGIVPDLWWGWGLAGAHALVTNERDKVIMRKNARRAAMLIRLAKKLIP